MISHTTDSNGVCQTARCGVYVEGMGPVPVLSGVGLFVEDNDDYRDFPMTVSTIHLHQKDMHNDSFLLLFSCSEPPLKW